MTALALVPSGTGDDLSALSLPELAEVAEREAALCDAAVDEARGNLSQALVHMIRCGEALIEARRQVPVGEFHAWLDASLPNRSERHWRRCVQAAANKDMLLASEGASTHTAFDRILVGQGVAGRGGRPSLYDEVMHREARRLRSEGEPLSTIARELDVSETTVRRWVDPDAHERVKAAKARSARMKTAAKKALEREERAREATARGDHHGKAYEFYRKLAQELDHALADSRGAEREALEDCRRDLVRFESHFADALRHARQGGAR